MPHVEGAEHRYITIRQGTARKVRLHVAESGEGAPVVLLHGHFQHWYAWRHVLPLLPEGRRTLCVDLRGFGWSEQTRAGYDLDTLADDISALITQLELGPVQVLGHDLGAQVALRLAERAPECCAGVLAVNTYHPFVSRRLLAASLWRMWFTAFLEYPVLGSFVVRHWPGLIRSLLRHGARGRGGWSEAELDEFTEATRASARPTQQVLWRYVLKEMPRLLLPRRAGRLEPPVVLLTGAADPTIPARLLAGDDARTGRLETRLVAGHGHQLPIEAPEEIAAALASLG
jgi:pimeloyl-ACP methyl ester carboxylesterase